MSYATIEMTEAEIMDHIFNNPCTYYDYITHTLAEWQNWLENSEVNNYTKITDHIYINNCDHCYVIKQYDAGTVYSWMIRRIK